MSGRGKCSACGLSQKLRKDGTVQSHPSYRWPTPLAPCEGSHQEPAQAGDSKE